MPSRLYFTAHPFRWQNEICSPLHLLHPCLSTCSKWQSQGGERRSKVTSLWSRTIRGGGHVAYYIDTYPTEACNYLPAVTLLSAATSERSRRIRPEGAALPPSAEPCYFTATALALTKTSTWRKGGSASCERKAVLCKVACSLSSVMVGSVSGAAVTTAEHQTLNHLVSELDKSSTSLRTCSSLSEWS